MDASTPMSTDSLLVDTGNAPSVLSPRKRSQFTFSPAASPNAGLSNALSPTSIRSALSPQAAERLGSQAVSRGRAPASSPHVSHARRTMGNRSRLADRRASTAAAPSQVEHTATADSVNAVVRHTTTMHKLLAGMSEMATTGGLRRGVQLSATSDAAGDDGEVVGSASTSDQRKWAHVVSLLQVGEPALRFSALMTLQHIAADLAVMIVDANLRTTLLESLQDMVSSDEVDRNRFLALNLLGAAAHAFAGARLSTESHSSLASSTMDVVEAIAAVEFPEHAKHLADKESKDAAELLRAAQKIQRSVSRRSSILSARSGGGGVGATLGQQGSSRSLGITSPTIGASDRSHSQFNRMASKSSAVGSVGAVSVPHTVSEVGDGDDGPSETEPPALRRRRMASSRGLSYAGSARSLRRTSTLSVLRPFRKSLPVVDSWKATLARLDTQARQVWTTSAIGPFLDSASPQARNTAQHLLLHGGLDIADRLVLQCEVLRNIRLFLPDTARTRHAVGGLMPRVVSLALLIASMQETVQNDNDRAPSPTFSDPGMDHATLSRGPTMLGSMRSFGSELSLFQSAVTEDATSGEHRRLDSVGLSAAFYEKHPHLTHAFITQEVSLFLNKFYVVPPDPYLEHYPHMGEYELFGFARRRRHTLQLLTSYLKRSLEEKNPALLASLTRQQQQIGASPLKPAARAFANVAFGLAKAVTKVSRSGPGSRRRRRASWSEIEDDRKALPGGHRTERHLLDEFAFAMRHHSESGTLVNDVMLASLQQLQDTSRINPPSFHLSFGRRDGVTLRAPGYVETVRLTNRSPDTTHSFYLQASPAECITAVPGFGHLPPQTSMNVTIRLIPSRSAGFFATGRDVEGYVRVRADTGFPLERLSVVAAQIPPLRVYGRTLRFSPCPVGESRQLPVLVHNLGAVDGEATVRVQAGVMEFQAMPVHLCVKAGGKATVMVSFVPSSVGPVNSSMTISTPSGETHTVQLLGHGGQSIQISDDSLNFGPTNVVAPDQDGGYDKILEVRSNDPADQLPVSLTASTPEVTFPDGDTVLLPPNGRASVRVRLRPVSAGPWKGRVRLLAPHCSPLLCKLRSFVGPLAGFPVSRDVVFPPLPVQRVGDIELPLCNFFDGVVNVSIEGLGVSFIASVIRRPSSSTTDGTEDEIAEPVSSGWTMAMAPRESAVVRVQFIARTPGFFTCDLMLRTSVPHSMSYGPWHLSAYALPSVLSPASLADELLEARAALSAPAMSGSQAGGSKVVVGKLGTKRSRQKPKSSSGAKFEFSEKVSFVVQRSSGEAPRCTLHLVNASSLSQPYHLVLSRPLTTSAQLSGSIMPTQTLEIPVEIDAETGSGMSDTALAFVAALDSFGNVLSVCQVQASWTYPVLVASGADAVPSRALTPAAEGAKPGSSRRRRRRRSRAVLDWHNRADDARFTLPEIDSGEKTVCYAYLRNMTGEIATVRARIGSGRSTDGLVPFSFDTSGDIVMEQMLLPWATASVGLRFTSPVEGTFTKDLRFDCVMRNVDDFAAGGTVLSGKVVGTARSNAVSIYPELLDLGDIDIVRGGSAKLAVTNESSVPVSTTAVVHQPFAVSPTTALLGGRNDKEDGNSHIVQFDVDFTPLTEGTAAQAIAFEHAGRVSTVVVAANGGRLSVHSDLGPPFDPFDPEIIDMGVISTAGDGVRDLPERSMEITNTGTLPIPVSAISSSLSGCSARIVRVGVAAAASVTSNTDVEFVPGIFPHFTDRVVLGHDDEMASVLGALGIAERAGKAMRTPGVHGQPADAQFIDWDEYDFQMDSLKAGDEEIKSRTSGLEMPLKLKPGESMTLAMTFDVTHAGLQEFAVAMDCDFGGPAGSERFAEFHMCATFQPRLQIHETELDFGVRPVDVPVQMTTSFTNVGAIPVTWRASVARHVGGRMGRARRVSLSELQAAPQARAAAAAGREVIVFEEEDELEAHYRGPSRRRGGELDAPPYSVWPASGVLRPGDTAVVTVEFTPRATSVISSWDLAIQTEQTQATAVVSLNGSGGTIAVRLVLPIPEKEAPTLQDPSIDERPRTAVMKAAHATEEADEAKIKDIERRAAALKTLTREDVLSGRAMLSRRQNIDFGHIKVKNSKTITATLFNLGHLPAKFEVTNLSARFQVKPMSGMVLTRRTTNLSITFYPIAERDIEHSIFIKWGDKLQHTLLVQVKGGGGHPKLNVTTTELSFDRAMLYSDNRLPLTLKNNGDAESLARVSVCTRAEVERIRQLAKIEQEYFDDALKSGKRITDDELAAWGLSNMPLPPEGHLQELSDVREVLRSDPDTLVVVPPMDSRDVDIVFHPTTLADLDAALVVRSVEMGSSDIFDVRVSGTVDMPVLEIEPADALSGLLDFGVSLINQQHTRTFTISNSGMPLPYDVVFMTPVRGSLTKGRIAQRRNGEPTSLQGASTAVSPPSGSRPRSGSPDRKRSRQRRSSFDSSAVSPSHARSELRSGRTQRSRSIASATEVRELVSGRLATPGARAPDMDEYGGWASMYDTMAMEEFVPDLFIVEPRYGILGTGQSQTFTVTFSPTVAEQRSRAVLVILNKFLPIVTEVSGVGGTSLMELLTPLRKLTFGACRVGGTFTRDLVLSNPGNVGYSFDIGPDPTDSSLQPRRGHVPLLRPQRPVGKGRGAGRGKRRGRGRGDRSRKGSASDASAAESKGKEDTATPGAATLATLMASNFDNTGVWRERLRELGFGFISDGGPFYIGPKSSCRVTFTFTPRPDLAGKVSRARLQLTHGYGVTIVPLVAAAISPQLDLVDHDGEPLPHFDAVAYKKRADNLAWEDWARVKEEMGHVQLHTVMNESRGVEAIHAGMRPSSPASIASAVSLARGDGPSDWLYWATQLTSSDLPPNIRILELGKSTTHVTRHQSVYVVNTGSVSAQFIVRSQHDPGFSVRPLSGSILPGHRARLDIAFCPLDSALERMAVQVSFAGAEPLRLLVSGEGTSGNADVTYTTAEDISLQGLDYGLVQRGHATEKRFVLSNTGSSELTCLMDTTDHRAFSLGLAGDHKPSAGRVKVAEEAAYAKETTMLAPMQTVELGPFKCCVVRCVLRAPEDGTYASRLLIRTEYNNISLVLRGRAGTVGFSHGGNLHFGEIACDQTYTRSLVLRNSGSVPCQVMLHWKLSGRDSPATEEGQAPLAAVRLQGVGTQTSRRRLWRDAFIQVRNANRKLRKEQLRLGLRPLSLADIVRRKAGIGRKGSRRRDIVDKLKLDSDSRTFEARATLIEKGTEIGDAIRDIVAAFTKGHPTAAAESSTEYDSYWDSLLQTLQSMKIGHRTPHVRVTPTHANVSNSISAEVNVSLRLSRPAAFSATLVVVPSIEGMKPYHIPLTARAAESTLAIDNCDTLDFGRCPLGESRTIIRTIVNKGRRDLFFKVRNDNTGLAASPHEGTLAAGASTHISVVFRPIDTSLTWTPVSIVSETNDPLFLNVKGGGGVPRLTVTHSGAGRCDFGRCMIGKSSQQTITVRNSGNAPLTLTAAELSGHAVFSKGKDWPVGKLLLEPEATLRLLVVFKPTSEEAFTGLLTIRSTSDVETVALAGSGRDTVLAVKPLTIGFPNCIVGNSYTEVVTASNAYDLAYDISARLIGRVKEMRIVPRKARISPFGSVEFRVEYHPRERTDKSIRLQLVSSFGACEVPISLSSGFAQLVVEPDTGLDFGTFEQSQRRTARLRFKNTGTLKFAFRLRRHIETAIAQDPHFGAAAMGGVAGTLTLDAHRRPSIATTAASATSAWSASTVGPGSNRAPYTLSQWEGALAPGDVAEIVATYRGGLGPIDDTLLLETERVDEVRTIKVSGRCAVAKLSDDPSITPDTVEFGDCIVGDLAQCTHPLTNVGDFTCSVHVTVDPPFDVSPARVVIGPGETSAVTVSWRPSGGYSISSILRVVTNSETRSFPIHGHGHFPVLHLSPTKVDFGVVAVGSIARRQFRVINAGYVPFDWHVTQVSETFAVEVEEGTVAVPSTTRRRPHRRSSTAGVAGATRRSKRPSNGAGAASMDSTVLSSVAEGDEGDADAADATPPDEQLVTVSFAPTQPGTHRGTVTVHAKERYRSVDVVGIGGRVSVHVSAPSSALGDVPVGSFRSVPISLKNSGSVPLEVAALFDSSNAGTDIDATISVDSFSLEPGQTQNVRAGVRVHAAVGQFTRRVVFDCGVRQWSVRLTGNAVGRPPTAEAFDGAGKG